MDTTVKVKKYTNIEHIYINIYFYKKKELIRRRFRRKKCQSSPLQQKNPSKIRNDKANERRT